MQFRFRHGAFEAEQEPVVEVPGVVEAVLVEDQGAGQRADLQEPVPVGVVAGEAAHLQAQHDPGVSHADLGDQPLEAVPALGGGAGLSLVGVDDDDLGVVPAQRDCPAAKGVLPGGGFGVVDHLFEGGLPDSEVGVTLQMFAGHLARRGRRVHE